VTWLGGLRPRLVAGVAAIVALCAGLAFVAVYHGTGSELRRQSARDLRSDMDAFARSVMSARGARGARLAAERSAGGQPFRATSRLLYAVIPGGPVITNEPELLNAGPGGDAATESPAQEARERAAARSLLNAEPGLTERHLPDAGNLLVDVRRLHMADGTPVLLGLGESTAPTERAKRGVAKAFGLGGALALLAAVIGGTLLAGGVASPLRRMAGVAARVDSGDLSPRMAARRGQATEVRALAESFDRMLDRLQDAFARQTAFVADASHELRTPLTVIRGQLEVLALQAAPSPEEVRRVERLVLTEIDRMGRLTEDLLVLAHADEDAFLRRADVAVAPFAAELLEGVAATADRRFALGRVDDVHLAADPDRLAQALRNLLRNAIEHTESGGLVRLEARQAAGVVAFAVDDDGPGIPAGDRARIFDRFHRVDASRSRRDGGAGLGLAIVKAVAEAHGGTVFAGDSPEGGARVGFTVRGSGPRGSGGPPAAAGGHGSRGSTV
jgi:two-component system, OmpR family, sensor kinase